ncbi:PilW family protein [Methylocucumis oryzae]|uniref:Pilus assembly protein PilW n=1 Tax=Methylocucumis oryzae TaxID=1632867 RepID=A0A0F3IEI2_9GAMM|nr:PilW family protein [Methylocucumis oryzae]KJV05072.1 hypothetical protein VZ94_20800 [Methylocucumis oryzae]
MKTTNMRFFNQNGLTLVEILVAMVLGTFLIGGVLEVYLSNKQTSLMQNNLSELQENGRAAMNILARDIRMAGFHGDFSFRTNTNIVDALPISPSLDSIVSGVDSGQPNYWTAAQQAAVVPDTDVITVMFARPCGGKLQPPGMTNPSSPIPISANAANNCNITAGDAVFITDNSRADIFLATNNNATNITHARLLNTYGTGANAGSEIFPYFINSYYIGIGANNRPALFRFDNVRPGLGVSVQELIEGIEDMQILYGINTDADIAPNFLC